MSVCVCTVTTTHNIILITIITTHEYRRQNNRYRPWPQNGRLWPKPRSPQLGRARVFTTPVKKYYFIYIYIFNFFVLLAVISTLRRRQRSKRARFSVLFVVPLIPLLSPPPIWFKHAEAAEGSQRATQFKVLPERFRICLTGQRLTRISTNVENTSYTHNKPTNIWVRFLGFRLKRSTNK